MDRRGWPWKKKSSDKTIDEKSLSTPDSASVSLASAASLGEQDNYQNVSYVQLTMDSYMHLTGLEGQVSILEDQVKILEDQVKGMNDKLFAAHSEIIKKDNLVKQHAKVAEEAVSGWEKADAEALALKHQLESVTLLKLTAEDRASQLDTALKECIRQIRNVKQENEQKLHEIVLSKTKQWDNIKMELEAKIVGLDEGLLRSAAENDALSQSLQEQSSMLMKLNDENSQAEAEIELLKQNIQSCEKEINSLKYELHVVSKELDIRNEEKSMSIRSAEVANKQHLEGVRKIAKLEAECQRLRGLVRRKLPGPAALAQMKLEVENLNQDFGEPRLWRTAIKNPNPLLSPQTDNSQHYHKEIEFLTTRLLAMEEETKMLKEALTTRNIELKASRDTCEKVASRMKSLEAQIQTLDQQNSSNSKFGILTEGSSSQYASKPPSLTSMSEDGVNEEGNSAESLAATTLISDLISVSSDKSTGRSSKPEKRNHLEFMDDFLEMERLACLSNASCGAVSISSILNNNRNETMDNEASSNSTDDGDHHFRQLPGLNPSPSQVSSNVKFSPVELQPDAENLPLLQLRSRILTILEPRVKDTDMGRVLEDMKHVIEVVQHSLSLHSMKCFSHESQLNSASSNRQACSLDITAAAECESSSNKDSKVGGCTELAINQDLVAAITQIHQFVLLLGREAIQVQDTSIVGHDLGEKCKEFSASVDKFLFNEISLVDFIFQLSHVFSKISGLNFSFNYKGYSKEVFSGNCVDKPTLLESMIVVQDDLSSKGFTNGSSHSTNTMFASVVVPKGNVSPHFGLDITSSTCSVQELEQLKSEKYKVSMDLERSQDLGRTKLQLHETEQLLLELKSQLALSQKSNSLAETQLKCVTESYKSLEMSAQQLEAEVSLLKTKTENLEDELLEEKRSHQDVLAQFMTLKGQMQRNESSSKYLSSCESDLDKKIEQEREFAAAAAKLAECQETIHILGKQLKALHPQKEIAGVQANKRLLMGECFVKDEACGCSLNPAGIQRSDEPDQAVMDNPATTDMPAVVETPSRNSLSDPSPAEDVEINQLSSINQPVQRPTQLPLSSTSGVAQEKYLHGFSRFFSLKGKSGH